MVAEKQPAQTDPQARLAAHLKAAGPARLPLQRVVRLLADGPRSLAELVRLSALPRRTIQELLEVLTPDVISDTSGLRIRPEVASDYRGKVTEPMRRHPPVTELASPEAGLDAGLLAKMAELIAAAPRPTAALDHVPATAETALRRALWLEATYGLSERRILLVGDHDLTALALLLVRPEAAVTVVDVDERLLAFLARQARGFGGTVRCLFADLRHGLPPAVAGWADVVVTDPPYTPAGVRLFCTRGLQGLRDRQQGRLVVAYGFGEHQPTLGLQVQRAIQQLHLVFGAILPGFNRYHGAQAVGSASDLYVCQPTPQTWKALERHAEAADTNIYTHGRQSLEAAEAEGAPAVLDALWRTGGPAARVLTVGPGLATTPVAVPVEQHVHATVATVLTAGPPRATRGEATQLVLANLGDDPGGWLLRLLLAVHAHRVVALLPATHPDLDGGAISPEVARATAPKYTLDSPRTVPDTEYVLVLVEKVEDAQLDSTQRLVRRLLERPHGTVAAVWRESLVALGTELGLGPVTKNQARAIIRALDAPQELLEARLVDLPRDRLAELRELLAQSVQPG